MNAATAPGVDPWLARRTIALLLAINLLNFIDRYVLAAVVPKLKQEFFAADDSTANSKIGLLFTAFLFSYMFSSPIFGRMADRTSRWLIIGSGVALWSLASGASGLATSFTMLLLTRLLVGVGEAAYGPSAPTVIADLYPKERRGTVLAWFYMAIPVGSALGYAWGGYWAGKEMWRWAFYLTLPPGLLLAALAIVKKDIRGKSHTTESPPVRMQVYRQLWQTPSYVFNTLGMTAMTFAVGGIASWMPTYVHEFAKAGELGEVNMTFGGITVLAGLTATLSGGILGDKLTRRWPGAYFLVSGVGMLLAFPIFLAALWTPFPLAWGLIFLSEFCLFFNTGPTNTILANVTSPSIRASGYAVNILIIHLLGDAISPTLIGIVTDASGGDMRKGFLVASAAIVLGGVFWLCGARYLEQDTRKVSEGA